MAELVPADAYHVVTTPLAVDNASAPLAPPPLVRAGYLAEGGHVVVRVRARRLGVVGPPARGAVDHPTLPADADPVRVAGPQVPHGAGAEQGAAGRVAAVEERVRVQLAAEGAELVEVVRVGPRDVGLLQRVLAAARKSFDPVAQAQLDESPQAGPAERVAAVQLLQGDEGREACDALGDASVYVVGGAGDRIHILVRHVVGYVRVQVEVRCK